MYLKACVPLLEPLNVNIRTSNSSFIEWNPFPPQPLSKYYHLKSEILDEAKFNFLQCILKDIL